MSQEISNDDPAALAVAVDLLSQPLAAIFDSLDIAITSATIGGHITSWNAGAEKMYGYSRGDAIGKHYIALLTTPNETVTLTTLYEQAGNGTPISGREVIHINRDGRRIDVLISIAPLRDTAGEIIGTATVARDISERRIREHQLLYQTRILQNISDAVISTDMGNCIRSWNHAAEQIYGWSAAEVIGQQVEEVVVTKSLPEERETIRNLLATQGIWTGEIIHHHRDGRQLNIEASVTLLNDESSSPVGYTIILRDITLRKQLEREIIQSIEFERERIGRDLHDGLASQLAGLAMLSRSLVTGFRRGNTISVEVLEELSTMLSQGAELARTLAHSINPRLNKGLAAALHEMAARTHILSGISCSFHEGEKSSALDSRVESNLFWIAQEAVNNAIRHSGATEIAISISNHDGRLLMSVEDNGSGIATDRTDGSGGMGLHTMQYRTSLLNGTFTIMNRAGNGTIVSCSVPLSNSNRSASTINQQYDTNIDSR